MIKRLIIVSLVLFDLVSYAQCTDYYRLTRIQKNGTPNRNVSGGQFITFINSICFESDSKGDGVGHGYLSFSKEMSNSQFSIYKGSSYWGKATVFKFNSDKSILNVVLDNGDIYVYKRATAPAGQETCSLIRKPGGGGGGGIVMPPASIVVDPYNPTSAPTPEPNPDPNPRKLVYEQVKCSRCNGTGQMAIDTYPPMFGQPDSDVWCSICGRNYKRSRGHSHITCTECKGSGTVTKTRIQ